MIDTLHLTMDRRVTPFSGRVAAPHLKGIVEADFYIDPEPHCVRGHPFLTATPGGARDRQLLSGDRIEVYERIDGWAYVRSGKDGYCGWLAEADLADPVAATHRVIARTTWGYAEPGMKQPALAPLHFLSQVTVLEDGLGQRGRWSRVEAAGEVLHVPTSHLQPLDTPWNDPTEVLRLFLGTPYVWAGNTGFGIDCSGLVQLALHACGIDCPGDSDLQEAEIGQALSPGARLGPGDLLFWKGHVAMLADSSTLIHANAHAMSVCPEPVAAAILRIREAGDEVTARKRL